MQVTRKFSERKRQTHTLGGYIRDGYAIRASGCAPGGAPGRRGIYTPDHGISDEVDPLTEFFDAIRNPMTRDRYENRLAIFFKHLELPGTINEPYAWAFVKDKKGNAIPDINEFVERLKAGPIVEGVFKYSLSKDCRLLGRASDKWPPSIR